MLNTLLGKRTLPQVNAEIEALMQQASALETRRAFLLEDAAESDHAAEKVQAEYNRISLRLEAIPAKIEKLEGQRRQLELEQRKREFEALKRQYQDERTNVLAMWDEYQTSHLRAQAMQRVVRHMASTLGMDAIGTREQLFRLAGQLSSADMLTEDELFAVDQWRGEPLTQEPQFHLNELEARRAAIEAEVRAEFEQRYGVTHD